MRERVGENEIVKAKEFANWTPNAYDSSANTFFSAYGIWYFMSLWIRSMEIHAEVFYCNLFVVCISFVSVGFCRILHATVAAASSALSHQFYAFRTVARAHITQAKHTGASIKHLIHNDDIVKREQWLINTKFISARRWISLNGFRNQFCLWFCVFAENGVHFGCATECDDIFDLSN